MFSASNSNQIKAAANTVRALSIDAIQKANSGHPGLPLGCADLGSLLFSSILKHDPSSPQWFNRDRFVLSAGHGSMFLYSLLHLCGYGLELEELKNFRQLGSLTPGHPEYGLTKGVEMTTGPLGAGFATSVGMALAETQLAAKFNTSQHAIIDHYTYVLAGDGCLMEGVSAEAASMAGHMGLGKLIVFYDSNHITIEGETGIAFTESVSKRFDAYGWQVLEADGYDLEAINAQIIKAQTEGAKPSLIVLKTTIGYGSPNKAGSHEVHGAPLGADEVKATKSALGLDPEKEFFVPESVYAFMDTLKPTWKAQRESWEQNFNAWAKANPELKKLWDAHMNASLPDSEPAKHFPQIAWPSPALGTKQASRSSSGAALQALAADLPYLIGGSADLAPSNNTYLKGLGDYQKNNPAGRNLHYGVREHAMGSVVNGITLHGGFKAYGATFLVFADYMRPSLRLASIMKIPSVFVFTHDSFWVGEDGPTHQPIEHLASLRMIPGLEVFRPADAEETNYAWELSLKKGFGKHHRAEAGKTVSTKNELDPHNGPSVLALTRQNLEVFEKPADWKKSSEAYGAYAVKTLDSPDAVVLATGSEVGLALEAAKILGEKGKKIQVLSILSLERFRLALQKKTLPKEFLPQGICRFACEAGHYFSFAGLVDEDKFLGINRFGESGPGAKVAEFFGLTSKHLSDFIDESLNSTESCCCHK